MSIANPPRQIVTFEAKRVTIDMANELGVDIAAICEEALRAEVRRRWQEANADAIKSINAWVEEHGLPLEKHRLF
ncbi:MAG: hypothetical protein A4S12_13015 [Proteobacteria bacterium SG_bin5]|nr:type II toxin-antitoxin system CcdA family antitoxin [Sphingomonas sp.]OQW45199.1 MAG: hypothetical protein A4S12_13015 [Proteobacteria bacterium SG_bin5]